MSGNDTAPMPSPYEQGLMLQAAADEQPPIEPRGVALGLQVTVLTIVSIATIVVGLRVYVRAWLGRSANVWGWEDSFAVLGYAAFLCSSIFCVYATHYGLGTRDVELNPYLMVRCAEYMLYSNVIYGVSMPLIKASVVLSLVRLTPDRRYHHLLYFMLLLATVMAVVGILASLLHCRPVRAYWNPLLGTCGDFMFVVRVGYAWTVVGIVTDWMCAVIPWFIVRDLQLSGRKKLTVMVILGLGAVASTASIVRAPYLKYYLAEEDQLYWNGYINLWCQLESGLGLIAVCLPALRLLFRKFIEDSRNRSARRTGYGSNGYSKDSRGGGGGGNLDASRDHGARLDNLSKQGKTATSVQQHEWERLSDAASSSSKQHIVQTRTVVVDSYTIHDEDKMRGTA